MMTSPTTPSRLSSLHGRYALALLFITILYLAGQQPRDGPNSSQQQQYSSKQKSTDDVLNVAAVNPLLCQEDDFTPYHCSCRDPAIAYMYKRQLWRSYHQRMKQEAAQASNDLDVVFLGDSIFERLNGTRMNGHQYAFLSNKQVFNQYFQTNNMKGMILGSSGDTTGHFLWHLQNGLLPESLQPKVFVLLIGTTNMGRDGCNKRTTLAGILQVIRVLHEQKPKSKILVHGLLPCIDQKPFRSLHRNSTALDNRLTLGKQWENTLWINAELKKTCNLWKHCSYMDSGDVFITSDGRIKEDLMLDLLHPSLAGYKIWVPRIYGRVELLLQGKTSN